MWGGGKNDLAKETITFIDHTKDSLIILPKSGKTILISKTFPCDKIEMMDEYLSTKAVIPKEKNPPAPDRMDCTTHYDNIWVFQNQYKQVSGKYLGIGYISNSRVSWATLHNKYGFTNIRVTGFDTMTAHQAGFRHDSIMIDLGYNTSYYTIVTHPPYKYYFVDEPYEHVDPAVIWFYSSTIENYAHSYSKLLISDYKWPESEACDIWSGDGSVIWEMLQFSNTYIMCDQYGHCGNICGNTHDFWDEYKAYYGIPVKNLTNWITLWSQAINDWGDLLNLATPWGMNPVWVYAGDATSCDPSDYIDESRVASFSNKAWMTGWLLKYAGEYRYIWKCTNPGECPNGCDWPESGNWYLQEIDYIPGSAQYLHY
jgi:hypothetical protein